MEIVISLLILSLVVAGMFGMFITSHKNIIEVGHRLQALNYARRVAESLKVYVSAASTPPANAGTEAGMALDDGTGKNPVTLLGLPAITIPGTTVPACTYDVAENVTVDGNPTTLEEVTVNVSWTEPT